MTPTCRCFRYWLDDDPGRPPELIDAHDSAGHLAGCPTCQRELQGIVVQRTAVREELPSDALPPVLPGLLVARCVASMRAAARAAKFHDPSVM